VTKQAEDDKTRDLFGNDKRGRGRPSSGKALTDAQRAKRYRQNKKAKEEMNFRDASQKSSSLNLIKTNNDA
jgi:hypothetical protein